ncbi:MAG: ABC transporter permease [Bacteroidota bacterium]
MEITIPKKSIVFSSLLRADFTTQWRNRRSFILILLVPIIILISWKGIIDKLGGTFALSTCITLGLIAIGLMGYTNSIARDRDKGIFQRLRVAPLSSWQIMASRLTVQLAMIMLLVTAVFFAGYYIDKISISPAGYAMTFLTALMGGAVYLGLGQLIAGMIKNAETVNSTTRLVYFLFIIVGMFGELGALGEELKKIVRWSPYGVVKMVINGGMQLSAWSNETTTALFVALVYAVVFATLGIKKFQWGAR